MSSFNIDKIIADINKKVKLKKSDDNLFLFLQENNFQLQEYTTKDFLNGKPEIYNNGYIAVAFYAMVYVTYNLRGSISILLTKPIPYDVKTYLREDVDKERSNNFSEIRTIVERLIKEYGQK